MMGAYFRVLLGEQWSFVIMAYLLTAVVTLAVTGWAYLAMRRAERDQ